MNVTLNIGGKRVQVGEEFKSLSPEEQQRAVDEIASQIGISAKPQPPRDAWAAAKAGTLEASAESLARHQAATDIANPPQTVKAADGTEMFMDPRTGAYTSRELLANNAPANPAIAAGLGYMRGYTLNGVDEAIGAIGGDFKREQARAWMEANQSAHPLITAAGEITGAVTNPVTRATAPTTTVAGAGAVGGAMAAIDAFGRSEGENRVADAWRGMVEGGLFSLGLAGIGKFAHKGIQALTSAAQKRPTVDGLRGVKNAAYRAVDDAGEVFTGDDMSGLYARAKEVLKSADFDDIADPQTAASLRILEARQGQEVSLGRLDKLRQALWTRYNRSDEPLILDLIGEVDDLIESKAGASELMRVARDANSTYRRAEMLESAFRKADLQTSATGSGGNILNKYRQAVTSIITNPKKSKWFTPEQVSVMEQFVKGSVSENAMRRIGKMAPSGNGLMTALNVYAASVDPTLLFATGASQAAKTAADRAVERGKDGLLDMVSGYTQTAPQPNLSPLGAAGGIAGNNIAPELMPR